MQLFVLPLKHLKHPFNMHDEIGNTRHLQSARHRLCIVVRRIFHLVRLLDHSNHFPVEMDIPPLKRFKPDLQNRIELFESQLDEAQKKTFSELLEQITNDQAFDSGVDLTSMMASSSSFISPVNSLSDAEISSSSSVIQQATHMLTIPGLSLSAPRGKHDLVIRSDGSAQLVTCGTASKPPTVVVTFPVSSIERCFIGFDSSDAHLIISLQIPITVGKSLLKAIIAKLAKKHKIKDSTVIRGDLSSMIDDHLVAIDAAEAAIAPTTMQLFGEVIIAACRQLGFQQVQLEIAESHIFKSSNSSNSFDCITNGRDETLALLFRSAIVLISKTCTVLPLINTKSLSLVLSSSSQSSVLQTSRVIARLAVEPVNWWSKSRLRLQL